MFRINLEINQYFYMPYLQTYFDDLSYYKTNYF